MIVDTVIAVIWQNPWPLRFFDFANAINTIDDPQANQVIRDELKRLVEKKGGGPPKGRKKLAQTPQGSDLVVRLLDEAINPVLIEIAERVFSQPGEVSRLTILSAIDASPKRLI